MFRSLTSIWKNRTTDASMVGMRWRFMYGFGAGLLMAARIIDDPTDINVTKEVIFTIIGVSLLVIGEYFILQAQDEFWRRVEERAMATGGIMGTALTLLWIYIARLYTDIETVLNVAIAVLIVGYVGIRTVYATVVHERNKDLDCD